MTKDEMSQPPEPQEARLRSMEVELTTIMEDSGAIRETFTLVTKKPKIAARWHFKYEIEM